MGEEIVTDFPQKNVTQIHKRCVISKNGRSNTLQWLQSNINYQKYSINISNMFYQIYI